jgi:hypothetical protein
LESQLSSTEKGRSQLEAVSSENANLKSQLAGITAHLSEVSSELSSASSTLLERNGTIQEQESEIGRLREVVANSDKTQRELKLLIQRSVDAKNRAEQQIDALRAELQGYASRISDQPAVAGKDNVATIVKLEAQVKELEQRLAEAQPSADLQAKNAKLTGMLEKSNLLYGQMMDENKTLRLRLMPPKLVRYNAAFFVPPEPTLAKAPERKEAPVVNAYLKTTLIQFFGQDADRKGELVPMILELVGCTPEQIAAGQRQWARSNHLIQKTTGFFGF